MGHLPVFVYGTLRHGQSNYRLLAGRTAAEFRAYAPGLSLVGHGIPFAVECAGSQVVGELMHIADHHYDAVLRDLDRLEGYRPRRPEASLYLRVERFVRCRDENGSWTSRRAYLYLGGDIVEQFTDDDLIPGGDWVSWAGGRAA